MKRTSKTAYKIGHTTGYWKAKSEEPSKYQGRDYYSEGFSEGYKTAVIDFKKIKLVRIAMFLGKIINNITGK